MVVGEWGGGEGEGGGQNSFYIGALKFLCLVKQSISVGGVVGGHTPSNFESVKKLFFL